MDEATRQMIESLRANPAAIQSLFRSRDGQDLLRRLTQGDQGAALQQAARSAAQGDSSEMVRMVGEIMRSAEGAALVERISRTIRK